MNRLSSKVPSWYWVVAVVMLVWNLLGVLAFLQQIMMSPEILAEMTQAEQDLYNNMPMWVTVCFGLAVFGGFFGSMGLVLKKKMGTTVVRYFITRDNWANDTHVLPIKHL